MDLETLQTLARVRKLLAEGMRLVDISRITGWSLPRISYVRDGKTYREGNELSPALSINSLGVRKPTNQGAICRRCGESKRLYVNSGLCLECEVVELSKIGVVTISEPELKRSK